jgi:hypothetical protein
LSNVSVGRKYEERIAKFINGKRMPKQHYGHSTHDVESDQIIGECKLRKSLSAKTWMQQVEEHRKNGKICVVFAKEKGEKDTETIVFLRILDFWELLGGEDGTNLLHDPDNQEE